MQLSVFKGVVPSSLALSSRSHKHTVTTMWFVAFILHVLRIKKKKNSPASFKTNSLSHRFLCHLSGPFFFFYFQPSTSPLKNAFWAEWDGPKVLYRMGPSAITGRPERERVISLDDDVRTSSTKTPETDASFILSSLSPHWPADPKNAFYLQRQTWKSWICTFLSFFFFYFTGEKENLVQ